MHMCSNSKRISALIRADLDVPPADAFVPGLIVFFAEAGFAGETVPESEKRAGEAGYAVTYNYSMDAIDVPGCAHTVKEPGRMMVAELRKV